MNWRASKLLKFSDAQLTLSQLHQTHGNTAIYISDNVLINLLNTQLVCYSPKTPVNSRRTNTPSDSGCVNKMDAEITPISVQVARQNIACAPGAGECSVALWSSVADMSNTFWPIVGVVVSSNETALWSCLLRLFYLGTGRCLACQTMSSNLVRMFCRMCMFWNTFTAACAVKINKLIGKKLCELYNVVCS